MAKKNKDDDSTPAPGENPEASPLLDEQGNPIETTDPKPAENPQPAEEPPILDNPEGARNTPVLPGVRYALKTRDGATAKDAEGNEITFDSSRAGADALRQKQIERPGDEWRLVPIR